MRKEAQAKPRPWTWRDVSEERTAFHEAGHAVVAIALGVPIRRLALYARGPRDLGVLVRSFGVACAPFSQNEVNAIVALAGAEAEKMRFGDYFRDGAVIDLDQAVAEIERACGASGPAIRRKYRRIARKLLGTGWGAVEALAAELQRRRRMTGKAVAALVRSRMRE